jgi:ABC-type multidrug transport system ATPase subunit
VLRRVAELFGSSVLFVEQHVSLALAVADRAYVLSHGRLALAGSASSLREDRELLRQSYMGELDATRTPAAHASPATAGEKDSSASGDRSAAVDVAPASETFRSSEDRSRARPGTRTGTTRSSRKGNPG